MKPTVSAFTRFIGVSSAMLVTLPGCNFVKPAPPALPPSPPAAVPAALSQKQSASLQQAMYGRQSIITQKDYSHLIKIQQQINQTQRLSDADVTFLVSELDSLSPQNTSASEMLATNLVLDHTYGMKPKILTPPQRHRLYDAIVPYTRIPDSATQVNASLALASTRDPRAIARLESLSWSSPYPVVRLSAADFLRQLQKVLKTSQTVSK